MVRAVTENDLGYLDDFADNPFWTCSADRWHKIDFYLRTGETKKNDKGWKVLHMDIEFTEGSEGLQQSMEIPFWLRKLLLPYLRKTAKQSPNTEKVTLLFERNDEEDGDKTIRTAKLNEVMG